METLISQDTSGRYDSIALMEAEHRALQIALINCKTESPRPRIQLLNAAPGSAPKESSSRQDAYYCPSSIPEWPAFTGW